MAPTEAEQSIFDFTADGAVEQVRELLARDAGLANAKDEGGGTPLHVAANFGQTEIVELLLGAGSGVNFRDGDGRSALFYAVLSNEQEVMRLLLVKGADLTLQDKYGGTCLHPAASRGHTDAARLLLEAGANGNAKDREGKTPLYIAAYNGHTGTVALLVEKGADLNAQDNEGRTALYWAAYNGDRDIVRLLVDKGANTQTKDSFGATPLQRAIANGHTDCANILQQAAAAPSPAPLPVKPLEVPTAQAPETHPAQAPVTYPAQAPGESPANGSGGKPAATWLESLGAEDQAIVSDLLGLASDDPDERHKAYHVLDQKRIKDELLRSTATRLADSLPSGEVETKVRLTCGLGAWLGGNIYTRPEGMELIRKGIQLLPEMALPYTLLGGLLMGDSSNAFLEQGPGAFKRHPGLSDEGLRMLSYDLYTQASYELNKAIRRNPADPSPYYVFCTSQFMHYAELQMQYIQALVRDKRRSPEFGFSHWSAAMKTAKFGQGEEAIQAFLRAMLVEPEEYYEGPHAVRPQGGPALTGWLSAKARLPVTRDNTAKIDELWLVGKNVEMTMPSPAAAPAPTPPSLAQVSPPAAPAVPPPALAPQPAAPAPQPVQTSTPPPVQPPEVLPVPATKTGKPKKRSNLFRILIGAAVVVLGIVILLGGRGMLAPLKNAVATATATRAAPSPTQAATATATEQSGVPLVESVLLRNDTSSGQEVIYQDVHFSDSDGDVYRWDFQVISSTNPNVQAEGGTLDIASDLQKVGAVATGTWTCGGSYTVTLAVTLYDLRGHESLPYQYTMVCGG